MSCTFDRFDAARSSVRVRLGQSFVSAPAVDLNQPPQATAGPAPITTRHLTDRGTTPVITIATPLIALAANTAAALVIGGLSATPPVAPPALALAAHTSGPDLPGVSTRAAAPRSAPVVMPDLEGQTVPEVELTVKGLGMRLCPPVTERTSDPAELGRVIGQSPFAGLSAPLGSQVIVVVGGHTSSTGETP